MKQESDKYNEETHKMTPVSRGLREFSKDGDIAALEPSQKPRERQKDFDSPTMVQGCVIPWGKRELPGFSAPNRKIFWKCCT